MTTWRPAADHPFGLHNLPYGVFVRGDGGRRVGVAVGDHVLDLTAASRLLIPGHAHLFTGGSLDGFLAAGRPVWTKVREALTGWLSSPEQADAVPPLLLARDRVRMVLPFTVADYVDFYASEQHATNVGKLFRPGQPPLPPNWRHLPIGYHGRAGTVVVSGTPITRPSGQWRRADDELVFGPSRRLDLEAEVGFVVGTPSTPGHVVPLADLAEHVFGVCLVNDWSARDIQAWESAPLGPFLGKSFATSVSPWLVPLSALADARCDPPARDPAPLSYLDDAKHPWALDIDLAVALNGRVISRPPFAGMYWTAAQQLAHLTVNGAALRTGDLFASGTVSGPADGQQGSLLELTLGGARPVPGADRGQRTFLEDGDEVVITGTATTRGGAPIGLGEVRGQIVPGPITVRSTP